jgi:hypothetical protein
MRHAQTLVAEADQKGMNASAGSLQALYHQIAEGCTDAQEFAADDWAVDRMQRLDHTKRECLAFLRKFAGYAEREGFRNGRKKAKTGLTEPVQDVANHFRSLPAAWERLARLESRFKTPAAQGGGSAPAPGR